MGGSSSKDEDDAALAGAFDTSKISYNRYGNLIHGGPQISKEDRDHQVRFFSSSKIDIIDEDEDRDWYIMDASWVTSWLAYAHFDKDVSPAPGPCTNYRLLTPDLDNNRWKPRKDLVMATSVQSNQGDYRRVSKEVWEKFEEFFPGCGPTIITKFKIDPDKKYNGMYDTSGWTIDNTDFEKDLEELYGKNFREEHLKKKKKRRSTIQMEAGSVLPGGDTGLQEAASAVPSHTQDGLLTESLEGSIQPASKIPSSGLMEDNSVSSSLRFRGKEFLNVGNDILPKAPIDSVPPLPLASTPLPTISSGGGRLSNVNATNSTDVNAEDRGIQMRASSGSSGSGLMDDKLRMKGPPPAAPRAPRKSSETDRKLAGPPSHTPEKFFSDAHN